MKSIKRDWEEYPGPVRETIKSFIDSEQSKRLNLVLRKIDLDILILLQEKKNVRNQARTTSKLPQLKYSIIRNNEPDIIKYFSLETVKRHIESELENFTESEIKSINSCLLIPVETEYENEKLLELINNYIKEYTSLSSTDKDFIKSIEEVNTLKDEIQKGLYDRDTLKTNLSKLKDIKDKFIPKTSPDEKISKLINIGSHIELELNKIFGNKFLTFDGRRSKRRSIKRKTSKKISKRRSIKKRSIKKRSKTRSTKRKN